MKNISLLILEVGQQLGTPSSKVVNIMPNFLVITALSGIRALERSMLKYSKIYGLVIGVPHKK